jgi:hypothetical protein
MAAKIDVFWDFMSSQWSSELLCRVVSWLYSNVSEENTASFFRVEVTSEVLGQGSWSVRAMG